MLHVTALLKEGWIIQGIKKFHLEVHLIHQRSLVQLLSLPWSTVLLEKLTVSQLGKR